MTIGLSMLYQPPGSSSWPPHGVAAMHWLMASAAGGPPTGALHTVTASLAVSTLSPPSGSAAEQLVAARTKAQSTTDFQLPMEVSSEESSVPRRRTRLGRRFCGPG